MRHIKCAAFLTCWSNLLMSPIIMCRILFIIFFLDHGGFEFKRLQAYFLQDSPTPDRDPYFDASVPNSVTGLVGKTVYLNCKVKNLGNRTVSWIRHRDIHLLTVGRYTYTSDQRFEAIHSPHTEEWVLRIKFPQRKDSGTYECQISSTPPVGYFIYLTVMEPVTEIIGSPDMFINTGSTINLTCLVRYVPEPPPNVVWSHEKRVINFDSPRGGISLVTEKGLITTSRLLIQKATHPDTGLYTCDPSNADQASIRVHILNGEHPAAMQRGCGIRLTSINLISALAAPVGVLMNFHQLSND